MRLRPQGGLGRPEAWHLKQPLREAVTTIPRAMELVGYALVLCLFATPVLAGAPTHPTDRFLGIARLARQYLADHFHQLGFAERLVQVGAISVGAIAHHVFLQ
jgi:hypothetical protein